jgi:hypothetical protein
MGKHISNILREHDACKEAIEWIESNGITTLADAWDKCHIPEWMLWLHANDIIKIDDRTLRLFACRCIRETPIGDGRTVWDLLTDERSRNALEVAEKYANGEVTDEELSAARAAARAAAMDAARAAARAAARDAAWAAARDVAMDAKWAAATAAAWETARAVARAVESAAERDAAWAFQADILREMVGNPFKK